MTRNRMIARVILLSIFIRPPVALFCYDADPSSL
jgi:hypothetical protein